LLLALRPRQWVKNVFVFAALVFAGHIADGPAVLRVLSSFGVFCVLSSAVYLINDVRDREADRLHPTKRHRPIAAGEIRPQTAAAISVVLAVCAFCGLRLGPEQVTGGRVPGPQPRLLVRPGRVVILDV
jgi:decaprenyl-phosphate phosphoribosyltransferase